MGKKDPRERTWKLDRHLTALNPPAAPNSPKAPPCAPSQRDGAPQPAVAPMTLYTVTGGGRGGRGGRGCPLRRAFPVFLLRLLAAERRKRRKSHLPTAAEKS